MSKTKIRRTSSSSYENKRSDYKQSVYGRAYSARGLELAIYVIISTIAIILMFKCTFQLSSEEGLNWEIYKNRLQSGYMFNRHMDNSDLQYSGFRSNILSLLGLLFAHQIISVLFMNICQRLYGDFQVVSSPTTPSVPLKLYLSLPFSFIVLSVLFGASVIKIFILHAIGYFISKSFKGHYALPFAIWTFSILLLFLNNFYNGYRFDSLSLSLHWLDEWKGMGMKWHVSFNFAILRMISFGMDYYWRCRNPKNFDQHKQNCKVCQNHLEDDCPKARIEDSLFVEQYNMVNYFAYTLYFPLYLAGPIISFNDFISQCQSPSNRISIKSTIIYGIRWVFIFLLMEVMMHVFHVVAISKARAWVGFSPFQLLMVGFFSLKHIWLKLMIIWRFFRLWAMVDGIETVENMTRCMTNQHSPAEFWRTWHRSYNRWIIRYLYVPLGGSKYFIYSIWVIFSFVAIWHDIQLQMFAWGWLIALFLLPEYILTKVFVNDKWKSKLGRFHRYLTSFGATLNILFMVICNLIGFSVGLDGMQELLKEMFQPSGYTFFFMMLISLFSWVQLQFVVRELEDKRGSDGDKNIKHEWADANYKMKI